MKAVQIASVLPENNIRFLPAGTVEKLWGIPVGNGVYSLESIPAGDPDINWLDCVSAGPKLHAGIPVISGIVSRGGQRTFTLAMRDRPFFRPIVSRVMRGRQRELLRSISRIGRIDVMDHGHVSMSVATGSGCDYADRLLIEALLETEIIDWFTQSGHQNRWDKKDT